MLHDGAESFLNNLTHELLPVLDFVASGRARDVVRAIKRMSFGTNFRISAKENRLVEFVFLEWEPIYNCVFSDFFWRKANFEEIVGTYPIGPDGKKIFTNLLKDVWLQNWDGFFVEATPQWVAQMETKYGKEIDTEKVSLFENRFLFF